MRLIDGIFAIHWFERYRLWRQLDKAVPGSSLDYQIPAEIINPLRNRKRFPEPFQDEEPAHMPKVGKKTYAYTPAGQKAAKKEATKTGKKVRKGRKTSSGTKQSR